MKYGKHFIHFKNDTSHRMANLKKNKNKNTPNIEEAMKQLEFLYIINGNIKCATTLENSLAVF